MTKEGKYLRRRIAVKLILLLVIFTLIVYGIVYNQNARQRSNNQINHTYKIIHESQKVLTLSIDCESIGRGYVLTGMSYILEPFQASKSKLDQSFSNLKRLASTDSLFHTDLDSLHKYIRQRVNFSEHIVKTYNSSGLAGTIPLFQSGQGKIFTDSIRNIVARIQDKGVNNIAEKNRDSSSAMLVQNIIIFLGLLLLMVVLVFLLGRGFKVEASLNKILHEAMEEKVKARTKELEMVNRELEAFSYSVSHDLRTPLRAIIGFSQILLEDYNAQLDKEGQRLLNTVVHNAGMMGQLIDDLLTFSRMARLEMISNSVDMHHLVNDAVTRLQSIYTAVNRQVSIAALPTCMGDGSMLMQVWMNLLDNAFKYSSRSANPLIEVGFVDGQKEITYFVKDNGVGFDMKYSDKLFGVFQRLHSHTEFEGTGLGLALVKRIITKHGGYVWAESKLNEGSAFYFKIPKSIT